MNPITPTKYARLLERYAELSAETEIVRDQIQTAYDELWLEHLDVLKTLADAQMELIRKGGASHA